VIVTTPTFITPVRDPEMNGIANAVIRNVILGYPINQIHVII
jgi:hypothetical protein